MNASKIIAISQRVDEFIERKEYRDALDQRFNNWIRAIGGIPIPVPNTLGENLTNWIDVLKPDGIILSGGNDIGQQEDRDHPDHG